MQRLAARQQIRTVGRTGEAQRGVGGLALGRLRVDICQQWADNTFMARSRHPKKEIEAAIQYALGRGWRWRDAGGHATIRLLCPHAQQGGCQISVWSTPKNPQN